MIAYHGQQFIKDEYLARVKAHRAADELIHGMYWNEGKGCAVGCTVHSSNHAAYETELGIPRILARLEDGIFESLSNGRAQDWPEQFLSAIPVGADLSRVWPEFAVWMLLDDSWGVIQFAKTERAKAAIRAVGEAYRGVAAGGVKVSDVNWRSLRDAAAYAAAYAAYAAAYAAYAAADAADAAADAADAAADAADAAAYAADAAAYAADAAAYAADAAAYAAYAARNKWRKAQADKLLELLAAAPVLQTSAPKEG